jgi:hypothetical protein
MSEAQVQPLDSKSKIDILLKEYEALRGEILNRINNRWAITGYVIAAVALMASLSELPGVQVLTIASGSVGALVVLWWGSWCLTRRFGLRIAEIEHQINHLAGEVLLVWETRLGLRGTKLGKLESSRDSHLVTSEKKLER